MSIIKYAPIYFSSFLVLVKCLAISLFSNKDIPLFQWHMIPIDIAFSGFAFDVYALGTIAGRNWIMADAQSLLDEYGKKVVQERLRVAEITIVGVMFFWHLSVFLAAIHFAPYYCNGIRVTLGVFGALFLTYLLPKIAIEGRIQQACIGVT